MSWTKNCKAPSTRAAARHSDVSRPGARDAMSWPPDLRPGSRPWRETRKQEDARRSAEIHAHFSGQHHRSGGCGPVCTFGEW